MSFKCFENPELHLTVTSRLNPLMEELWGHHQIARTNAGWGEPEKRPSDGTGGSSPRWLISDSHSTVAL
mgnify:CR=1 FL=1